MDKGSSPKKSPPQLSPSPIISPYSPNNNNSPPDICSDGPHISKHDNAALDSPPRLSREDQTPPPKLSPKDGKESTLSEQEKECDESFTSPTPSVTIKKSTSPCHFTVGLDVLARWSDGLVYLGTILKVDLHRCLVIFEDNSEHWVLFKDLQKGRTHKKNSEITCVMCENGRSETPDEIVICDKCELGYHQLCHRPNIDSRILLTPDEPWFCRQCVFANSTKIGGALKRGPSAKAYQEVKKNLPYKLDSLKWDTAHKTNKEKCYCYCGGPGDWYLKMLQCCRCKQWFHEACVQCIDIPMMYGDRFYIFVCSVCNDGPEYLKKLPLKWVDLAHLLLYNLTLLHTKKYYDLDTDIMPFLMEHWNNLQINELEGTTRLEKQDHMLNALHSTKMKFISGREIKKKKALWGLRVRNPPAPPTIVLPAVGQITDDVMDDMQMKGRKVVTFVPVPSTSPVPLIPRKKGKKRTHSETDGEEAADKSKKKLKKKEEKERKKFEKAIKSGKVAYSASQAYRGYRGTDNFANLLHLPPVKKGQSVLDSIQPLESTFKCGGRGICKHKLDDELKAAAAFDEASKQTELRGESDPAKDNIAGSSRRRSLERIGARKLTSLSPKNCSVCCTSLLCTEHSPNRRRLHKKKRRRKAKREPDSSNNSPVKSPRLTPKKSSPIRTTFITQTTSPQKTKDGSPTKFASKSPAKSTLRSPTPSPVKSPTKRALLRSPVKSPKHLLPRSPPKPQRDLRSGGSPPSNERFCVNGINKNSVSLNELKRSVSSYFGAEGRLACGERYKVLGKRITVDGKVQYLIQWDGTTP